MRWKPLANLTNREAAFTALEQATGVLLPRSAPPQQCAAAAQPAPAAPIPLAGYTSTRPPGVLGAALVGPDPALPRVGRGARALGARAA